MRGKLQNFAKAAILAIAQQNCSIDDVWPCPQVRYRFCKHTRPHAMVFLRAIFKRSTENICDAI
ncbi:hypothetical protein BK661_26645 [Pseudomonas frederiksbergensis]|uniref:Uncharacterized protein n=1 Tax=Pseudomonas frederiksbergensis TaxID=104087 RepID=A0A423ING6_9PSED|nr:hypothetical protein BK661_26645 [Pseudomonas frederiksbergensis]